MKRTTFLPVLALSLLLASGCSFNRGNVAGLAHAEDEYYSQLVKVLQTNRATLQLGLTEQLKADLNRQRELLRWERDLAKAEVVLQAHEASTNDLKLLLMKTAESDLGSLDAFLALGSIDQKRVNAVLSLYDALIKAIAALGKNNQAITKYLEEGNAAFALRSFDVAAMASAISGIRNGQRELQGATALSADEQKKATERLEKNLEQAQKTLINALSQPAKK